jgi:hypothetical protein
MNESDIITGIINIPLIKYYNLYYQERNHHAHIFIPSQNKFINMKFGYMIKKKIKRVTINVVNKVYNDNYSAHEKMHLRA